MSNWKLALWAALGRRLMCETCGELYATTTAIQEHRTRPACEYCATWIAAGSPLDYQPYYGAAYQTALDSLPRLLLHRPTLRDLNRLSAAFDEERDEQVRAEIWEQHCRQYTDATPLARWAYDHPSLWWGEARHCVGTAFHWVRITVSRPDCARCGAKATTTSRLRDDSTDRTPLCDDCCFAINDSAERPAGGDR